MFSDQLVAGGPFLFFNVTDLLDGGGLSQSTSFKRTCGDAHPCTSFKTTYEDMRSSSSSSSSLQQRQQQ